MELVRNVQTACKQHFHSQRARDSRRGRDSSLYHLEESARHRYENWPLFCPSIDHSQAALNYKTYLLADKTSQNDEKDARTFLKRAEHLQLQIKLQLFDSFDLIRFLACCPLLNCRVTRMMYNKGLHIGSLIFHEALRSCQTQRTQSTQF